MLEKIIKKSQEELFDFLKDRHSDAIVKENSYIFVEGEAPVLFVAHLDTVHKTKCTDICKSSDGDIIMSPQGVGGDDRCGVYALEKIYSNAKVKPYLLFTCNEEIGGLGAISFADDYSEEKINPIDVKFIIELDRMGFNDAVYYECSSQKLRTFIEEYGYVESFGSYSDICDIAPVIGAAAVNLSCGYYNAHTVGEYIRLSELENTIKACLKILEDIEEAPYCEWEAKHSFSKGFDIYDYMYSELLTVYDKQSLQQFEKRYGRAAVEKLYYKMYDCDTAYDYENKQ